MCRRGVLPAVTAFLLAALPCAAQTCSIDGAGAANALGVAYKLIRTALGVPPGSAAAPVVYDIDLFILGLASRTRRLLRAPEMRASFARGRARRAEAARQVMALNPSRRRRWLMPA